MLTRRGTSLVEVLIALTLGSVVLAFAIGSLLRQQRNTSSLTATGSATAQLRAATALLPAQLSLLSAETGDLVKGEVRDTALQLRTAIATGAACDSASTVALAMDQDTLVSSGIASLPRGSDSLWAYDPDSSRWTGHLIVAVLTDSSRCGNTAPARWARQRIVHMQLAGSEIVPALAPLRVTRQVRIAIYRAGDGTLQLGFREWSESSGSFAGPQPVAGPFARVTSDGARTGFRFFDVAGVELHPESDPGSRTRIARIRLTALSAMPASTGTLRAPQRDSADVVLRPVADP